MNLIHAVSIGLGTLTQHQAATTILLALLSNIVFKSGLTLVIGGGQLAWRALPGFASVAAGAIIGWLLI